MWKPHWDMTVWKPHNMMSWCKNIQNWYIYSLVLLNTAQHIRRSSDSEPAKHPMTHNEVRTISFIVSSLEKFGPILNRLNCVLNVTVFNQRSILVISDLNISCCIWSWRRLVEGLYYQPLDFSVTQITRLVCMSSWNIPLSQSISILLLFCKP